MSRWGVIGACFAKSNRLQMDQYSYSSALSAGKASLAPSFDHKVRQFLDT